MLAANFPFLLSPFFFFPQPSDQPSVLLCCLHKGLRIHTAHHWGTRLRPAAPREEIWKLWEGSFYSCKVAPCCHFPTAPSTFSSCQEPKHRDLIYLFLLEIKYREQSALQQHRERTKRCEDPFPCPFRKKAESSEEPRCHSFPVDEGTTVPDLSRGL